MMSGSQDLFLEVSNMSLGPIRHVPPLLATRNWIESASHRAMPWNGYIMSRVGLLVQRRSLAVHGGSMLN
jgi:hypothetical protein